LQHYKLKNSGTFKDLETQIQGLSRTNPVLKYFQGLEFRDKTSRTFKDAWEPCLMQYKWTYGAIYK